MRRLLYIIPFLWAIPAFSVAGFVQEKDGTAATLTLTGNTTIGNALGVIVSSPTPTTVKIGTQTLSQVGVCTPLVSSEKTCAFATSNLTVASNSVTCGSAGSCGTMNAMAAVEFSGTNSIEPIVGCFSGTASTICQETGITNVLVGLQYQPGYSSEGVMTFQTCSGSSGTQTLSGLTSSGSSVASSGNAVAWGISSSTTLVKVLPTSACNQSAGLLLAFIGTGATQQPVANPNQHENSAIATSGSATISATIFNVGDLVVLYPWCISTCGVTTLTLGAQNATCPAGAQGASNTQAGKPGICYVVANTSGSLTVTFTPSGSPSNFQVSYQDFTVSNNATVAFDTAATSNCQSGCSEGAIITVPSITPAQTGSLLVNFISTFSHVTNVHAGSPQWGCYINEGSGDTLSCQDITTINMSSWILLSAAGATTANADIANSNDPYQSIIASFKLSGLSASSRMTLVGVGP